MNNSEYTKLFHFLSSIQIVSIQQTSIQSSSSMSMYQFESNFMSDIIKQKALNMSHQTKCELKIHHFDVTIHIYSTKNEPFFLNNIIHVIHFVISLFKETPSKRIQIKYYLTDELKKLPEETQLLKPHHINSGSCFHSDKDCEITIWRKEEIVKVTIHELIHALHTQPLEDTPELIQYYQQKYNISSEKINIDESYVEIWANLLNCFILSLQSKQSSSAFIQLIQREFDFCNHQSKKIKDYSEMNQKLIDINKHTNVLAYYIIRCELFQNLTSFLKYCRMKNNRYICIKDKKDWYLFFNKQQQKQKQITYTEPPLLTDKISDDTLRMTINEIPIL